MMYAADPKWWRHHAFCPSFKGEKWTQQRGPVDWPEEAARHGLEVVWCKHSMVMSKRDDLITSGWNSAFQALNIAVLQGAKRILLLGIDLHDGNGTHWFGNHPPGLQKHSPYATFRKAFVTSAPIMAEMGVEVINCSFTSALTCFPVRSVEDALRECATAQQLVLSKARI